MPEAFIWGTLKSSSPNYVCHKVLTFSKGISTIARRAWTLISTHHSWISSHRPWDMKLFSTHQLWLSHSGNMFFLRAMDSGSAFGPLHFVSVFAIGHRTQTVPYICLPWFEYLLPVIRVVTAMQITAVLPAGSRITWQFFYSSLVLTSSPDQVEPYLGPRAYICLSLAYTLKLQMQQSRGPLYQLLPPSPELNLHSMWN